MIKGIDVASYQAATYPTSGLDFVFVKATEGTTYVNPKQGKQTATARTAGLALGFYHFLHAGDVKAQADYFVSKCASLPGDMLVCDWETPPGGKAASNREKDSFLKEVKRLRPDHRVGLYCNTDFWLHRDTTSYDGDFLWIADPNHAAGHPGIKATWRFHQYSISGNTDLNVAAFDSRAALRKWCGYPGTTVPAVPVPKGTAYDTRQDARITALEKKLKD